MDVDHEAKPCLPPKTYFRQVFLGGSVDNKVKASKKHVDHKVKPFKGQMLQTMFRFADSSVFARM